MTGRMINTLTYNRKGGQTCRRRRRNGNKAKDWIENNIREKTETSLDRREARTTEADTAAFVDKTEESLNEDVRIRYLLTKGDPHPSRALS